MNEIKYNPSTITQKYHYKQIRKDKNFEGNNNHEFKINPSLGVFLLLLKGWFLDQNHRFVL